MEGREGEVKGGGERIKERRGGVILVGMGGKMFKICGEREDERGRLRGLLKEIVGEMRVVKG